MLVSIIWANFVFLVSVTHLPKNNLFIAPHTCATLTSNIHSQTTNVDLAAFVTHKLEEISYTYSCCPNNRYCSMKMHHSISILIFLNWFTSLSLKFVLKTFK
jgi:hypothetical protein